MTNLERVRRVLTAWSAEDKRQGGTGLPFWSCPNFPFCKGKLDFTPHPDDVIEAGDEYKAQFASLERARSMGLERAR